MSMSVAPKSSQFSRNLNKSFMMMSIVYKIHHIIFGLDFGFFELKSFKIRVIVKVFSFIQCIFYSSICLWEIYVPIVHNNSFWYTVIFLHYVCSVSILLFFKSDTTFCSFFHDLEIIDERLKVNQTSYNINVKIVLTVLFSFLYRATLVLTYCVASNACLLSFWNRLIIIFVFESFDFVLITYTFVFYSVYCRLNTLVTTIEMADYNIVSLQHIYKTLLDVTEKYKEAFDLVFLTALMTNVPEVMASTYYNTEILLSEKPMSMLYLNFMSVFGSLALTFAPAIYAGKLTKLADRLKVVLCNKLIQQRDEGRKREIKRFIRYVEARECQFRVWKLIPLNASLIGMVLNFCATYLIVIIQFKHQNLA